MVKGSNRQVIVVKSLSETMFEQAIFFVREDAKAVSHDSAVAQAQKIARDYGRKEDIFSSSCGVHGLLWLALGASGASFLWAVGLYLGEYFLT